MSKRGLERTLAELEQLGTKVWIVKQPPLQNGDPKFSAIRAAFLGKTMPRGISHKSHRERQMNANSIIGSGVKGRESVQISDPAEYCFDELGYSRIGDKDGMFYADDDHLSPLGAERLLRPMFESVFRDMGNSTQR